MNSRSAKARSRRVGCPDRVAVLGGDGRDQRRWAGPEEVVFFLSQRAGGNGALRRLEAALRAGRVRRVVILARWNSHAVTLRVRRLCRTLGIAWEIVP